MTTAALARRVPRRTVRRRFFDWIGWALTGIAFALLSGAMLSIVAVIFIRGVGSLNPTVVTHVTEGVGGGLLNAIEGSVVLALGGMVLAIPPGVAAGIYLSEFDDGVLATGLRFLADVLVGVPSIVIGYFGYITMVIGLGWKFSVAAGSVALAIIALPYICRTTEMALREVPNGFREAAYALGARDWRVILGIVLPAAAPGIITGILLALAIAVGETAPLIYTAGWSSYMWNGQLTNQPIGYLTYAIWAFITEPFESAHALAYAAAFLVTIFVLIIGIASRLVIARRSASFRR